MDGRRDTDDTVVAGGGVTRKARAGSQNTETEGNLPSAEERFCRKSKGTDETVAVGRSQRSGIEGDFLLCAVGGHPTNTEEEHIAGRGCSSESGKQRNGGNTTFVGDGQTSGMEGECVVCEHIKEVGKEQSPAQAKAPPQK